MWNFLKIVLFYALTFYLVATVLFLFLANKVIFQAPPRSYIDSPVIIKLQTKDGAKISAIYLHNPNAKYVILYSHGNAVDLGEMLPFLKILEEKDFSIFAYDYHGYGTSTGKPNESNVYNDIEAAYDYLTQNLKVPAERIIVYGKSLGTAVSLDLASKKPIGGLILESPFVSAYRTVTRIPLIPFDSFDNLKKIKTVKVPVLIIHAEKDQVIAIWHGKKLFDAANTPKISLWLPDLGHNDLPFNGDNSFWNALQLLIKNMEKKLN